MPTASLKTGKNVTENLSKISNDELAPTDSNFSNESAVQPFIRIETTQRGTANRALETRESDMRVFAEFYGKSTKAFEMRRRANLAKAREMAVKMENYKKNFDLPSTGAGMGAVCGKSPTSTAIRIRAISAGSPLLARRQPRDKEKHEEHVFDGTENKSASRRSARRTGGGGGNSSLSYRARDAVVHVEPPTRPSRHRNVECQTSASDLLNWQVMTDAKVMQPSPALWSAILKKREDELRRSLLKAERFVPEYSKSEVNYQTNLKEFLETGTVRHYDREFENQNEGRIKLKSTKSDDLRRALRYKPRVQPEMDLKKRLPKIEEELMRVYKGRA